MGHLTVIFPKMVKSFTFYFGYFKQVYSLLKIILKHRVLFGLHSYRGVAGYRSLMRTMHLFNSFFCVK